VVFVAVADPANLIERAFLYEFFSHIWLPLLPGVLLLLAANALMIRRALKPVSDAARWARGVSPGAPPPPPPGGPVPAEIADLVEAAERALVRLAGALEAEKRRAAEAAHALRTPVAVLTARLDSLPPGDTRDALREDLLSFSRTVQQLLAASAVDALVVDGGKEVDLSRVAEEVIASLAPYAIARGVDLSLDVRPPPAPAVGDAGAIELALRNLVENAIHHAASGGRVEVTAGPGAVLRVRDHGEGLPPGPAERLFRPFFRGARAPAGGAGLGLAIVDRVQRAHGGTVEAKDHPQGGAEFRLAYRAAADPPRIERMKASPH
jgi:two-component system OmpR family sensor kinase